MKLTIGDRSRDGLYEIADTRWDGNGTMFVTVTVRELFGKRELEPRDIRAMRRLARRAISMPHLTKSSRLVNSWYSGINVYAPFDSDDIHVACSHATFAVSRH